MNKTLINWDDFLKVDIRVGTIIKAEKLTKAKNPSYIIYVDFGEFGLKKSAAQITKNYLPKNLIGQQIIAVLNFPKKQIGPMMSECLVTGFLQSDGSVILAVPDKQVSNGLRLS